MRTDALVLINSTSVKTLDFQHYIQPYLDNFGVPYSVQDIATNNNMSGIGAFAVVIVGHGQLDTNHNYLDSNAQLSLAAAISNGTGLVNFDGDLSIEAGTPRYQFVQDIFGFNYEGSGPCQSVVFPPTEPLAGMHYVTALHPTNETLYLSNSISLTGVTFGTNVTALALGEAHPFLAVTRFGLGRAVQWGSYAWMATSVQGPVNGLDDLVWRGLVWAARKPFVMRGLPNFVAMRVDDVSGPLWWVHVANEVGFKPYLGLFISDIDASVIPDLRSLVTNGNATASIHSFASSSMFYFNHQTGTPYSDEVMSNIFAYGVQWHQTHGIPSSKSFIPHYSEIGPNAFQWLPSLGIEFIAIEVVPGTIEYGGPPDPWLMSGPYRRFGTPGAADSNLPLYYADFLSVPGHPELDGHFFNRYTEIRNSTGPGQYECGEWCVSNDVQDSINRGTRQIKRALDSMVLASVFTHEWWIHPTSCCGSTTVTTNNWRAILQGITNNIAAYQPIFVTTDYADQYVRATRTSRIASSQFDIASGQVIVNLSGKTDLPTSVQVFVGADNSISNSPGSIPIFNGSAVATLKVPPIILSSPASRTNIAGTSASFSVNASGSGPLGYQWFRDGTNRLSDGGKVSGAATAALSLAQVSETDAGNYFVVVTNAYGSATSSSAQLVVVPPPPPFIQSINLNPGLYSITWSSVPGETYRLQYKDSFTETSWHDVVPDVIATGTSTTVNQPMANSGRLYRVILFQVVPLLEPLTLTNRIATIAWSSMAGKTYRLQYKNSLNESNWLNTVPDLVATGPRTVTNNVIGRSSQRFFRVVLLQASPPPIIESVHFTGRLAALTWSSVGSLTYRLQYNDNLGDVGWLDSLPDVTATGPMTSATNALGNSTQRFFRLKVVP
jgi:hypothetical protein